MSHLDAAKALVAEHVAASNHVLTLLNQLTSQSAATTAAAVAAATSDVTAANDLLSQQINASLAQLQEIAATHAGAPATPANLVL
jgi:hypothetical protein